MCIRDRFYRRAVAVAAKKGHGTAQSFEIVSPSSRRAAVHKSTFAAGSTVFDNSVEERIVPLHIQIFGDSLPSFPLVSVADIPKQIGIQDVYKRQAQLSV